MPVLEALVEAGHEIAAVYCQPPRPAGRGKKLRPTPVHARAEALALEVRHPVSLKGAEEQEAFAALNADVAVVVAYGLILPQAVLDAPAKGCLNIHASLLPRWRGAAPAWQQRGVDVEASFGRRVQNGLRQDQAIGDDNGDVGVQRGKSLLLFCALQRNRVAHLQRQRLGPGVHRRWAQLLAPARRARRLAIDGGNLVPGLDQSLQHRHREGRR